MSETLIKLIDVSKIFGSKLILDNINLEIKKGQSIAFVGHNGSGKSTLLKIIAGLVNVSGGKVLYDHKLKFNYIPEHFPKMNITANEFINYMGAIEGISLDVLQSESEKLFKEFFMDDMKNIPIKHLSKGTLQKVAVIQALLSMPDVILLDEPLSGQDIPSQKIFISKIKELNQQGVTVVMSCHEMFLVRQISKTAYEIIDKNLSLLDLDKFENNEYDILIFEYRNEISQLNSVIKKWAEQIEICENEIKMIVSREKSNHIIKVMLNDNYNLRVMKGMQ